MATKKTVAIIGATGQMGSALAKTLAKGNYRLILFSTEGKKVKALEKSIMQLYPSAEIDCVGCSFHASWEADIIIPAVPFSAEKEIADNIKEVATQKIVLSISNPLNEKYDDLTVNDNTSAAEELQKLLPDSKIVKVFNTTFAADFVKPTIGDHQIDCLIAGDDEESLETVSDLVKTVGFNPVISGKLVMSRILEKMTVLMIQLNKRYQYDWHAGWKILHN